MFYGLTILCACNEDLYMRDSNMKTLDKFENKDHQNTGTHENKYIHVAL